MAWTDANLRVKSSSKGLFGCTRVSLFDVHLFDSNPFNFREESWGHHRCISSEQDKT